VTAAVDPLRAALADRYAVERELGRGGMATVYLARDLKHNRPVAIKVLHPELAAIIGGARFLREIEIAAHLQHPHILTLIDSGEAGGFLYYVMPFVDGESLRSKLAREHELPLAEASRILRDVADALAEAHAQGVVHRDIKPDNVLLRGQHAIVTDFGIAKAVTDATGAAKITTAGVAHGTPVYMAPEQIAADPATGQRADIYSFGVMAYEMLAGRPPFVATTAQMLASAHMTQAPEPITRHRTAIPTPLATLVMRCLEKKPADRWQRVDEIQRELEAMATPGMGTGFRDSGTGPALGKPRSNARVVSAVAALAIIAALAFALTWGRRGGPPTDAHLPMLAVLPLENIGAAADEYFAEGMTDELTSRLAKLSGLALIAPTSSSQYKKTTKAIPQIAKELGADYLVTGTVRYETQPSSRRVRITPKLVRASDGRTMWTEPYDKPYGSAIFHMQSEIAERVADALSVTLLAPERTAVRAKPTKNLRAYDYYLRAQAAKEGDSWEQQRAALQFYEDAARFDSSFALAYLGIANMHMAMSGSYDLSLPSGLTFVQRGELARKAAARALALDPELPRPHLVLAWYYYYVARDTIRSREELNQATRGNPTDAQSFYERGRALFLTGDRSAGFRDMERAATLDPRNAFRSAQVGQSFIEAREFSRAETYFARAIAISPQKPGYYATTAWLKLIAGQVDSARGVVHEGIRRAGLNAFLFEVSQASVLIRMHRIFADEYASALDQIGWDTFGVDSVDFYITKAFAYRTDNARARAYYDSLAGWAEPRVRRGGMSSAAYDAIWVLGLAGSGKHDAAMREINHLVSDPREPLEPLDHEQMAEACVLARELDCAMTQIIAAMADPYVLNAELLRIEPVWDPLRGRADFQKLVRPR
jgi:serine/threonine-protein kinase